MYNAKKDGFLDENQLKYDCIGDRCYFGACNQHDLVKLKSCYIPLENITMFSENNTISQNSLE